MAGIPGSLKLTGRAAPADDTDPIITIDPRYGQYGGYRVVADLTARNAILTAHRQEKMVVGVISTGRYYELASDLTTWVDLGTNLGASIVTDFTYKPSAPVQTQNVFKTWPALMAAIAALPDGSVPSITFVESVTINTTGMPVGGWNLRLATIKSLIPATGNTVVDVLDGVIFDNLLDIENGLQVQFNPTTAGSFNFHSPIGAGIGSTTTFSGQNTSGVFVEFQREF
jgi:hypothetical protein